MLAAAVPGFCFGSKQVGKRFIEVPAKCLALAGPKAPVPYFQAVSAAAYADDISHILIGEMEIRLLP